MGPAEWLVALFQPLLDMFGIDSATIYAGAANVVGYVSFGKRLVKKKGWAVWVIAGVAAIMLALPAWGNWGMMIVTALVTFVASAGMLFATGKGGNMAGNKFGPKPSKLPG